MRNSAPLATWKLSTIESASAAASGCRRRAAARARSQLAEHHQPREDRAYGRRRAADTTRSTRARPAASRRASPRALALEQPRPLGQPFAEEEHAEQHTQRRETRRFTIGSHRTTGRTRSGGDGAGEPQWTRSFQPPPRPPGWTPNRLRSRAIATWCSDTSSPPSARRVPTSDRGSRTACRRDARSARCRRPDSDRRPEHQRARDDHVDPRRHREDEQDRCALREQQAVREQQPVDRARRAHRRRDVQRRRRNRTAATTRPGCVSPAPTPQTK